MGGRMVGWRVAGAALGLAVAVASVGSSAASAAGHAARPLASSATKLAFRSNGTPILTGMTFNIGNAAGSAHIGDTNVANLVAYLKRWGANASQTNASHNATELAVAGGQLVSTSGPLPTEVDAGLVVFGPNQVHLDDELLVKKSIKTLADLKGKTIAYCCDASPDGVLLNAVLKKAGLKRSEVHILSTGASAASLNALIAGQVDGAFTAASGLPGSVTSKFRSLISATTLLPDYADSFMAATGKTLHQKPAVAEAIDLAWLASAKLFNTDESSWVSAAAAYTSNADPTSLYQLAWRQLKRLEGWPLSEAAFSASDFNYNLKVSKQQQALTGPGLNPSVKLVDRQPWSLAWAQFSAHEKSY